MKGSFNIQELAVYLGVSKRTFERRLSELREAEKFKKESPGIYFNVEEAQKLAELLKFKIPGTIDK